MKSNLDPPPRMRMIWRIFWFIRTFRVRMARSAHLACFFVSPALSSLYPSACTISVLGTPTIPSGCGRDHHCIGVRGAEQVWFVLRRWKKYWWRSPTFSLSIVLWLFVAISMANFMTWWSSSRLVGTFPVRITSSWCVRFEDGLAGVFVFLNRMFVFYCLSMSNLHGSLRHILLPKAGE